MATISIPETGQHTWYGRMLCSWCGASNAILPNGRIRCAMCGNWTNVDQVPPSNYAIERIAATEPEPPYDPDSLPTDAPGTDSADTGPQALSSALPSHLLYDNRHNCIHCDQKAEYGTICQACFEARRGGLSNRYAASCFNCHSSEHTAQHCPEVLTALMAPNPLDNPATFAALPFLEQGCILASLTSAERLRLAVRWMEMDRALAAIPNATRHILDQMWIRIIGWQGAQG